MIMKITLDIDKLLKENRISEQEYAHLKELSAETTGSLGLNLLLGFGVLSVVGGMLAILPSENTAIVIGGLTAAVGLYIHLQYRQQWGYLANICILAGALLMGGGIFAVLVQTVAAFTGVALLFAVAGALARSGLLMSLSAFAIFSAIGAQTGYFSATYYLGVEAPTLTVVLFSVLALGSFWLSKTLQSWDPDFESVVIVFSRTCVVIVNLGFWVGSLFGGEDGIGSGTYSIAWALSLIAVGIWAVKENRRWVVNSVAVFGSIHFYTQWFELLGGTPISVIIAGLIAIGIVIGLRKYNADREALHET